MGVRGIAFVGQKFLRPGRVTKCRVRPGTAPPGDRIFNITDKAAIGGHHIVKHRQNIIAGPMFKHGRARNEPAHGMCHDQNAGACRVIFGGKLAAFGLGLADCRGGITARNAV